MKTRILLILLCILTTSFFSCKEDDGYEDYNEVLITQIKYNKRPTFYEYNANGQVIKNTYDNENYSIYEYDDLGRLIKSSLYYGPQFPEYENELTAYDTFVYEDNKIVQTFFNDIGIGLEIEIIGYQEHLLNSNNECTELIEYEDDGTTHYSTVFTWSEGNITEYTMTYEDGAWYNVKYEYDNNHNPMKLLSCNTSPWDKVKNNVKKTITKSFSEEITIYEYSYEYNKYGFPIKKERLGENSYTYEYMYEIN